MALPRRPQLRAVNRLLYMQNIIIYGVYLFKLIN